MLNAPHIRRLVSLPFGGIALTMSSVQMTGLQLALFGLSKAKNKDLLGAPQQYADSRGMFS